MAPGDEDGRVADHMRGPDLEKQRRFALTLGLLVIAYFSAVVKPEAPLTFELLGAKLSIARPDLLPLALVLAAVYAALRFLYYACLIERTPWQVRRQMLADMRPKEDGNTFEYGLRDTQQVEPFVKELAAVFPYADRAGKGISFTQEEHPETRVPFVRVTFRLTKTMRVLAWLQDADFTAPIWVNGLALLLVSVRWIRW
jgi:hypothetical protein